jgi:taurine dehydrogenase large subunit
LNVSKQEDRVAKWRALNDAQNPKNLALLMQTIVKKFPSLAGIPIYCPWLAWVDVSHDMMPRIGRLDPQQTV